MSNNPVHGVLGKLTTSSTALQLFQKLKCDYVVSAQVDDCTIFYAYFKNVVRVSTVRNILRDGNFTAATCQARQKIQKLEGAKSQGSLSEKVRKYQKTLQSKDEYKKAKRLLEWQNLQNNGPEFFRSQYCQMPASIYNYSQIVKSHQQIIRQLPPHETLGNRGHWIYGKGGQGKTRSVLEYCKLAGIELYQKNGVNKYFNGYKGDKAIVLHNVRAQHLQQLETFILEWTDSVPVKGECKMESLFIQLQHDYFFITSTLTIDQWLKGRPANVVGEFKRRFKEWTVAELQDHIDKKFGVKKEQYIKPAVHMDL